MTSNFAEVQERIAKATCAEDVFEGAGNSQYRTTAVKQAYARFAMVVHPDKNESSKEAEDVFKKLTEFYNDALKRLNDGTYGQRIPLKVVSPAVVIRAKKAEYAVSDLLARGDIANIYRCHFIDADGDEHDGVFKVARAPRDNDLIANEAAALKRLHASTDADKYGVFASWLVDSVAYKEHATSVQRHGNVLMLNPDVPDTSFFTLKQVREAYPGGVDPKDMAWMWRRVLTAVGFAHQAGVVHGAILPEHVFIEPSLHGVVLIDWCYAVLGAESAPNVFDYGVVKAISPGYEEWYPEEVRDKTAVGTGTDIYMAAKCMIYVLGGTPTTGDLPLSVPRAIRAHLRGMTLPNLRSRREDAWGALEDFDDLIDSLWPRAFHPFFMPNSGGNN